MIPVGPSWNHLVPSMCAPVAESETSALDHSMVAPAGWTVSAALIRAERSVQTARRTSLVRMRQAAEAHAALARHIWRWVDAPPKQAEMQLQGELVSCVQLLQRGRVLDATQVYTVRKPARLIQAGHRRQTDSPIERPPSPARTPRHALSSSAVRLLQGAL